MPEEIAKMQDVNWNDLRIVLAAHRHSSYAAAGRQLNINETTVARRINRLESQLQSRLFDRISGRSLPTAAGERLARAAERIESDFERTATDISGADLELAGTVRLTAVPILINSVLIPAVDAFTRQFPNLRLELIADSRDLKLSHRETDIALRLARPSSETQMITRKLSALSYSVYARADLDADQLPWIGYEDSMRDLPQARWIDSRSPKQRIHPVRHNDILAVCECVIAGLGKSLLPDSVAERLPGIGRVTDSRAIIQSFESWREPRP